MEAQAQPAFDPDAKIYPSTNAGSLSIRDMLRYFQEKGTMRVSDLHLKVGLPPLYRMDGNLVKLKGPPLSPVWAEQLIYPLLSEANQVKFQSAYNIDSSYQTAGLQFRINVFRDRDGISAAVWALALEIPEIETIGFPNDAWQDILSLTQGLVLLTGVAGSGKSTTIASLIRRIGSTYPYRIITLEDPIEYVHAQQHAAISQRELGRDVGSFAEGLRAVLREDPNVIVVGEMRDPETIIMTLMAAETGHLVFSTLHTRDTAATINRILDYFPEGRQSEIVKSQLSLSLRYVISQKLVRRKDGQGRVVAMEIMNNDYACANLIRMGKIEQLYSQLQTKTRQQQDQKMMTLEKHLVLLVAEGVVEREEAQRRANNLHAFADELEYQGHAPDNGRNHKERS